MKKTIAWILAVLITLFAAVYQHKTGPTYPKRLQISIDNTIYKFKLIRSSEQKDAEIFLKLPQNISGTINYKKYPTTNAWTTLSFTKTDSGLVSKLPVQPPAGKLEYFITIYQNNEVIFDNSATPIIIRFKGDVPAYILMPHILFMFLAMLLSNLSGIFATLKEQKHKFYGIITFILLFIGGGILGPIVQKYAFGDLWTGIPFGWDLTDNKTLIALVAWGIAVGLNIKKNRPTLTLLASIILLLIYSIPHSMFGSELDPETGEIIQGFVINFFHLF
ncbi:MAG: hypothetical protein JXR68_07835 [Bacteroidales bacterium]|nr:hypothetical protein [Bacteroidales bacterium]